VAIQLGQVQVQKDDVWARGVAVCPFTPQERHGRLTIRRDVYADRTVDEAEGFLRQADITGVILDQQNLYGHVMFLDEFP
jgi:hypothetical protein